MSTIGRDLPVALHNASSQLCPEETFVITVGGLISQHRNLEWLFVETPWRSDTCGVGVLARYFSPGLGYGSGDPLPPLPDI